VLGIEIGIAKLQHGIQFFGSLLRIVVSAWTAPSSRAGACVGCLRLPTDPRRSPRPAQRRTAGLLGADDQPRITPKQIPAMT
jgi:hypothetical protein